MLRILERQNVKATFCMVGRTAEKRPDVVKAIFEKGHELAVHGWDHLPYYNMSTEDERNDIQRRLKSFRKLRERDPLATGPLIGIRARILSGC